MLSIRSILNRPLPVLTKLYRDRGGAIAIMLAIALSGIVGFAGLGSEVASCRAQSIPRHRPPPRRWRQRPLRGRR